MQSKWVSFIESSINVLLGLLVALVSQMFIFPIFGFTPTFGEQLQIALFFTGISIIRSYFVRRFFNYMTIRKHLG